MPSLQIDKNVSINYQCQGEGETIVLIHGLGANLAFWYLGISTLLAKQYRVISYDLRGHGRSSMPASGYTLPEMAQDLNALLDHLGVDQAHVVGHSFGARVALMLVIAQPNLVKTLTIADTQISCLQDQIRLRDWPHWDMWKRQLQEQGFDKFPPTDEYIDYRMLVHFNKFNGNFTQGTLNRKRRAPSLKRRDMGKRGTLRWERLMKSTSAKKAFGEDHQITAEQIKQIRVPTLAIFGEYSHCLSSCKRLNEYIPTCRVKILSEVGHFLPAIKPRLFVRALRRFLIKNDSERFKQWATHRRQKNFRDKRVVDESVNYPLTDSLGDLVLFDRRKPRAESQLSGPETQALLSQSVTDNKVDSR